MKASHRHTFDSIPWLVTGRLADTERQALEKHVSECAECRAELNEQQRIHSAINRDQPRVDYAPGASLQKLWTRIGESERDAPTPAQAARTNSNFRMRLTHWLAAAVVVEAIGLTLMVAQNPTQPTYSSTSAPFRTVSDSAGERSHGTVRIVFSPDVAVNEVNDLLRRQGMIVINGPTAAGVYTLAPTTMTPDFANSVQETLTALRAHPGVRFAEPVGAAAAIDPANDSAGALEKRP